MNIRYHRPILPDNLKNIFQDSVKDGWLTSGPRVKEFEQELSRFLNIKYVVAVNSCTAALHLAMAAKNFKRGDKFLVPTYTFVATAEVGEYLGMEPIFIDCENDGFNLDLNQVEEILKREKNIKAILPVHFAGMQVDMKSIFELSKDYNLFVLEDCAHSLENKIDHAKHITESKNHSLAYSFYANKNITTGGEGGAFATDDEELSNRVKKLSLHGMSKDGWKRFETPTKWNYDVTELGFKYNMTDVSASFGIWQLKRIRIWHKRRLNIVKQYNDGLKTVTGIVCPSIEENIQHSWHLYIIKMKPELWRISRNDLIKKINDQGIGTSVHYKPIHMHYYYKNKYGYSDSDYPRAEKLSQNVISLPLYPALEDNNIDYIIDIINKIWDDFKY